MSAQSVTFTGLRAIEVRARDIPDPASGEVLVKTIVSAISAGTEGLLYRDEAPATVPEDTSINTIPDDLSYPTSYGYAAVGRVIDTGEGVASSWRGRRVFAYHPHVSHFCCSPEQLVLVPDDLSTENAAMLANMETAVTFLLDGQPILGERVAVFGQGVVGLLTTALLAHTPLSRLTTVEQYANRRALSVTLGADDSRAPERPLSSGATREAERADLTYELTGCPDALDDAIAMTRYTGRVIVGSWYGRKPVSLNLGGRYHRARIDIQSSQVSTIAPRLRGRFSHTRRHEIAWDWLQRLDLTNLITHRFPVGEAPTAYRLLDTQPDEAIQVLLTYD